MVLSTVCALLGWLAVQIKWSHDRQVELAAIANDHSALSVINGRPASAPWPLNIVGEQEVEFIWLPAGQAKRHLELERLFPEAEIVFGSGSPSAKFRDLLEPYRNSMNKPAGG